MNLKTPSNPEHARLSAWWPSHEDARRRLDSRELERQRLMDDMADRAREDCARLQGAMDREQRDQAMRRLLADSIKRGPA